MSASFHHDELMSDTAAWVLGALPDDEAAQFAGHLPECDACRAEVARLQCVADVLALAAPPAEPSPGLKARIMDVVEREAEVLAAAGPEADRPQPARKPRERQGWWSRLLGHPWILATGAAALVAVGVVTGVLVSGSGPEQTTRPVTAVARAQGASGELVQRGDQAELRFTNMPPPPPGRVYQAWILRGNKPEPDSVFTVDHYGRGSVMLRGDPRGAKAVLITDEPAGGSMTPSVQPYVSVTPS
jgi:anti-sigma-K factor RskA